MKNTLICVLALISFATAATSCSEKQRSPETTATARPAAASDSTAATPGDGSGPGVAAAANICPMHPEVTGSGPGKCSKCGMDLVKQ